MENSETIESPQVLRAEITMAPDAHRLIRTSGDELVLAEELFPAPLTGQDQADLAGMHLVELRKRKQLLEAMKEKLTRPARDVINTALSWFQPGIKSNEAADAFVGRRLSVWQAEQESLAESRRRAAEQLAREARQAEERRLAGERARAEAQAREAAQKAAQAAQEAAATKTAESAAAAAAAESEAEAAEARGSDLAQAQLELSSAPLNLPPVAAVRPTAGIGFSDSWGIELEGTEAQVIEKLVLAAIKYQKADSMAALPERIEITRPELLAYVSLDKVALRRSAVALKQGFNVPGVRAVNTKTPRRK